MSDLVFAVGRVILPIFFIVDGYFKFTDIARLAKLLADKRIPAPQELQTYLGVPPYEAIGYLIAGLEVLGGILIIIGFLTRTFAVLLFLVAAAMLYVSYDFLSAGAAVTNEQLIQALKDLSIMGGLLLLAATGGGRFALGRKRPLSY